MNVKEPVLLTTGKAARLCGLHPQTLRQYANEGKVDYITINSRGDRRFRYADLVSLIKNPKPDINNKTVGVYVRVSGSTGQETSLVNQEKLCKDQITQDYKTGAIVKVFSDKGSGLNENRRGLASLLKHASKGGLNAVYVTDQDRLARFGVSWIEQLLTSYGVKLVVINSLQNKTAQEELVSDFISIVSSFAARLYGQRSAQNRRKLLSAVQAQDNT